MGKTRLSRTAAIVIMTSALAWNLPVLAQQDEVDDVVSVTVVIDATANDMQERGESERLQADWD